MKINRTETVVRYDVTLTPWETSVLRNHSKWQAVVSIKSSEHNGGPLFGCATLTRTQINDVCDVIGVNGREFMARYERARDMEERDPR